MPADKEIMKALETLRLNRPGRTYAALTAVQRIDPPEPGDFAIGLRELAMTFREEAELWTKSGARGWKSSEAEAYLIAQAVDDVATALDKQPSAPVREPLPRQHADTTPERLADFVADAVAEGRGMLRNAVGGQVVHSATDLQPLNGVERKTAAEWNEDPTVDPFVVSRIKADVSAYLSGAVDTLPGLAEALVPSSVSSAPEAADPFDQRAAALDLLPPYCGDCDHDQHRCYGCGEPVEHGKYACAQCEIIHADGPLPPCCAHMLDPDEDPAPWCDCRSDDDMPRGHAGPCKRQAHLRADHLTPAEQLPPMPTTWGSETLTADGHMKPGVAPTLAPTLGQPGDMGTGYSHSYVPPGGRQVTFAELLTPVPVASLPAHLSHSQGNTIGDCATKYRLQRVEQLPQIPQWANIGGTTFHAAVEAFERTVAKMGDRTTDGQPMSWAAYDCETVWKHHFEGQIAAVQATTTVPISVWRASRRGAEGRAWWEVNGPQMLRRYLDARPDDPSITIDSGGSPAIEWEVTADVPTPYGPLSVKAVLDRVTYSLATDAVMIRDYKTSYERPTDTTQLGEYAHLLMLSGANLHGLKRVLGTYFDARRGTWTEPVDLLADHPFEAFQYTVTSRHAQKRALTTGPTPARPSSFCGGCSVRYACPVKTKVQSS